MKITALLRLSRRVLVWWIMLHVMKLKGKKKKKKFRKKAFITRRILCQSFCFFENPYNHKITAPIILEGSDLEGGDPAHGKGIGTREPLTFIPTQTIL